MNRIVKRAGLAAGALAIGAGTYMGAARIAEVELRDRLLAATSHRGISASIDAISVNPLSGRVEISGVNGRLRSGATVRIGRVVHKGGGALSLISPAHAQQTHSYEMDDVEISGTLGTLSAEELKIEDASLNEDGLQDLIDSDNARDLINALKGLSFKSITSPEMIWELNLAGAEMRQVMKNVAFERMRNGRAERIGAESVEIEAKSPNAPDQKGSTGLYEVRGLDTVLMARFLADKAAPGEALATAYESTRIDNYKITMQGLAEYSIGRVESGAVRLKPLSIPLMDLIAKMPAAGAPKPSPEELKTYVPALLDVFNNISDDGFEARDLKVSTPAVPGGGGTVARISGSLGGGKVPAGFKIEGVSVTGPGVSVKLASLGMEGFSLKPTIEAAIKAVQSGDPDLKNVDPRTVVPKFGSYSLKGLEFDVPDPKPARGRPAGKITGGVGAIDIAAKNEIKGIPTDLSVGIEKLTLRLPQATADVGLNQLKALGYDAIDLSSKAALRWDEPKKEIQLSELSVSGVNMGSAKVTAAIGNVGRDIFEADLAMAQVAALGATAKSATVSIQNTGLAERLFEMQAKAQGRKPEEVRAEIGSMAALGIPAVLGPSDDAKQIAGAVAKFLARPRSLTLEATAKNAGGVGIPDMAMLTNPQAALSLISVKASAD
jgi:hypothetical protein